MKLNMKLNTILPQSTQLAEIAVQKLIRDPVQLLKEVLGSRSYANNYPKGIAEGIFKKLSQFYCYIIDIEHCICLRCTKLIYVYITTK